MIALSLKAYLVLGSMGFRSSTVPDKWKLKISKRRHKEFCYKIMQAMQSMYVLAQWHRLLYGLELSPVNDIYNGRVPIV